MDLNWRKRWLGQRVGKPTAPTRPIDGRVLVGVPDVFTGLDDTTYGTVRRTATGIRDGDWQTPAEQGLAITLLAVISDLEQVLEAQKTQEGSGGD